MKRIIVCIGVLLSVLAHGKSQEKINIAISAAPNNLNPFFSTDANSQNINRLVHKSLIDFNQKMQFECKACRTYSESMVGSKQVLKFSLREDLFLATGLQYWQMMLKNLGSILQKILK